MWTADFLDRRSLLLRSSRWSVPLPWERMDACFYRFGSVWTVLTVLMSEVAQTDEKASKSLTQAT